MDKKSRNIVPKVKSNRELTLKSPQNILDSTENKVKFEIFGEEMLEKTVKHDGNSNGRIYVPPRWGDHNVMIIRID
jgi:hypothetical protein